MKKCIKSAQLWSQIAPPPGFDTGRCNLKTMPVSTKLTRMPSLRIFWRGRQKCFRKVTIRHKDACGQWPEILGRTRELGILHTVWVLAIEEASAWLPEANEAHQFHVMYLQRWAIQGATSYESASSSPKSHHGWHLCPASFSRILWPIQSHDVRLQSARRAIQNQMGPGGRWGQNPQHQGSSLEETNESCLRVLNEEEKLFVQEVHHDAPESRLRALDIWTVFAWIVPWGWGCTMAAPIPRQ